MNKKSVKNKLLNKICKNCRFHTRMFCDIKFDNKNNTCDQWDQIPIIANGDWTLEDVMRREG